MFISEVDQARSYLPLIQQKTGFAPAPERNDKFVDTLNEFIKDVNSLQKDSSDLTARMIKGEPVDIHDVMIASEKAKTGFQLMLELRNKFLDMYHEVSRMQI